MDKRLSRKKGMIWVLLALILVLLAVLIALIVAHHLATQPTEPELTPSLVSEAEDILTTTESLLSPIITGDSVSSEDLQQAKAYLDSLDFDTLVTDEKDHYYYDYYLYSLATDQPEAAGEYKSKRIELYEIYN